MLTTTTAAAAMVTAVPTTATQKTITHLTSAITRLVEVTRDPGDGVHNLTTHLTGAIYVLAHAADMVGGEDGSMPSSQLDKDGLGAMLKNARGHLEQAAKLIAAG